jgi:hypothetical protein
MSLKIPGSETFERENFPQNIFQSQKFWTAKISKLKKSAI